MEDKLKWLTGYEDIEEFAKKINKKNSKNKPEITNLGLDIHCDKNILGYRNSFVKNGYVKIEGVFSNDEILDMEKWITNGVNKRFSDFNYVINGNYYSQQFSQCLNLWEDFPEIRKIAFSPKITRIAKSLLGVEKIRIWQDQALFKHPNGRNTSAHQDIPFWPMDDHQCLTAWIILSPEGSTLQNGALGYVPESHTSGLRHFSNITTGNSIDDFEKRDREIIENDLLNGKKPQFVEAAVGSIVFHHGLTVHLSKPNLSDKIRKVYTIVYFKDGISRGSQINTKQTHFVLDRKNLIVREGEKINNNLTPIAFPIDKIPPRPYSVTHQEYRDSMGSLPRPISYDFYPKIMSLL